MSVRPRSLPTRRGPRPGRRAPVLALALGLLLASAQASPAETLMQALVRAHQGNPALNAQRTGVLSAREGVRGAEARAHPRVRATADAGYASEAGAAPDGGRSGLATTPRGVGLAVEQTVFDGFRTANTIRQSRAQMSEAEAVTLDAEQTTLFDAVRAYVDVLADRAILQRARRHVAALAEHLRHTRERHALADATRGDVAQVEARLAGARGQENRAEGNLKTAVASYRQVVGVEPGRLRAARGIEDRIPRTLDAVVAEALAQHPALHAARHRVDVAALQADIQRGERFPTFSVAGLLERRHDAALPGDSQLAGAVMGRISLPLYDGGEIAARTAQARHVAAQRTLETEAIRDQIRAAAASGWGQHHAARARAANAAQQRQAARVALAGVREHWELGDRTIQDLLDAEEDALLADIGLIVAERDRIVATYALARVMGRLTLAALGDATLDAPTDRVFDPSGPAPAGKAARPAVAPAFAGGWGLRGAPGPADGGEPDARPELRK